MTLQPRKTNKGIGSCRSPRTPFTQAHKLIYDLENESLYTEIVEVSQQLVEACRHTGGVFCFSCDMWDETGISWQMITELDSEGNSQNYWFCGSCSLSQTCHVESSEQVPTEEETEVNNSNKETINFRRKETESEFSFDVEISEDVSPSSSSDLVAKIAPLVKSSKYIITSTSEENSKNLIDMPFKAKSKSK